MQIEPKEKRILTPGSEFSFCLVLYMADGIPMYQYCTLANDLPDDILVQQCEVWAQRNLAKLRSEGVEK